MMAATRSMANAPIGAVFRHTMPYLTAEEIQEAVATLLTRETPSSFAVTSGSDGRWDLRLSNHSYEYLSERLIGSGLVETFDELVALKNGAADIPRSVVEAVMVTLRSLEAGGLGGLLTLIDLVETARTGQPQFNATRIEELGLTGNGIMHRVVRDVVLSAIETSGEGIEISVKVVSPLVGK